MAEMPRGAEAERDAERCRVCACEVLEARRFVGTTRGVEDTRRGLQPPPSSRWGGCKPGTESTGLVPYSRDFAQIENKILSECTLEVIMCMCDRQSPQLLGDE